MAAFAALIDETYFIRILNTPNTSRTAVSDNLDNEILYYQERFLKYCFGEALYNDFVTGIGASTAKYEKSNHF